MHTQALIATWRSVKLQPQQHCCEGITVCSACCLLSPDPPSFSLSFFSIFTDLPLHSESSSPLTCCFHFAFAFVCVFIIWCLVSFNSSIHLFCSLGSIIIYLPPFILHHIFLNLLLFWSPLLTFSLLISQTFCNRHSLQFRSAPFIPPPLSLFPPQS